jgi:hypothetical protein
MLHFWPRGSSGSNDVEAGCSVFIGAPIGGGWEEA